MAKFYSVSFLKSQFKSLFISKRTTLIWSYKCYLQWNCFSLLFFDEILQFCFFLGLINFFSQDDLLGFGECFRSADCSCGLMSCILFWSFCHTLWIVWIASPILAWLINSVDIFLDYLMRIIFILWRIH